ncbi:MAG: ATP-binding cassette domain-containing protein [Bacilli bacterium]|nr:ATP-binding cassette domain-containing protein [Bacilli bacterium]
MPTIECKNLSFAYYGNKGKEVARVLNGLNATFENGKTTILLGESGSGKSSLLHLISGLNEDYEGDILFDGVDAHELSIRRRKLSYITQKVLLLPHITIFDNIASSLKYDDDIDPNEIKVRVRNIAKALKIEHCLSRKPKHLSYGQQHRVMLAKAFVGNPELILLDEAFTGLDEPTKDELLRLVKEWKKELGATLIVVTHDYKEALSLGDVAYVLEDGKIEVSIPKEGIRSSNHPSLVALREASKVEEKL